MVCARSRPGNDCPDGVTPQRRRGAVEPSRPEGHAVDAERLLIGVQGRASNSPSLALIRLEPRRAVAQQEKDNASFSAPPPRTVAGNDQDDGGAGGARALERPPVRWQRRPVLLTSY